MPFLLKYWSQIALGLALALVTWWWQSASSDRASLLDTISVASDARDSNGHPGRLSVKDANQTVRNAFSNIAKARVLGLQLEAQEAHVTVKTERADAQISTEVSTNVQAQLSATQRALTASRALAAERLRALSPPRNADGGADKAGPSYDPEPACQSNFAASCDEVLALLTTAESQGVRLQGALDFYAGMKQNHDAAIKELDIHNAQ